MSLPDGYLLRKGDVVLIRATAKRNARPDDTSMAFDIEGSYSAPIIEFENIDSIYARSWEEGDDVRNTNDHGDVGKVVATHEDKVWVKLTSGALVTFDANALEAMPDLSPKVETVEPPPAPGDAEALP